jgi:virulence-associated protein VapD
MYAILIELDSCKLSSDTIEKYMVKIENFLWSNYTFTRENNGLFIGCEHINAVDCVMITQRLNGEFGWFPDNIKEMHLLRIDEMSDLLPAIKNYYE